MASIRRRFLVLVTAGITLIAGLAVSGAPPSSAVNYPLAQVVSAQPVANTPYVLDGKVNAIAVVGNRVFVGGSFTTVKNSGSAPKQTINNLFVYNKANGQIDQAWMPVVDGQINQIKASTDGTAVFIAGTFHTVNGVSAPYLAKISAASNQLITAFTPGVNGWVNDIAVAGNKVYVGGYFDKLRNVVATKLGVVDATTGKPDATFAIPVTVPVRASVGVSKLDVSADGSRLVIIGNFQVVGGLPRVQIAVIDLSTTPASVANWATDQFFATACSTSFDTYMRGVDISPDGTYFAINTTGAWRGTGTLCDTTSRWELRQSGTGLMPTWVDWTGGDTIYAVAVTNAAIYVGGHQRWENNSNSSGDAAGPGNVPRQGLAALDPINGLPLTWNPSRDRGVGVFAMVATADGLYIGDDTNTVANQWHPRLAFFPIAGGSPNPVLSVAPLPGTLYRAGTDGTLTGQTFDGSTVGAGTTTVSSPGTGIDWSHVTGSFLLSGMLYTAQDDGTLLARPFDGTAFGTPVNLNSWTSLAGATGLFYDNGRLYFTMRNDSRLYYRYFSPQSGVVGSYLYTASGNGDGFDWGTVRSLTSASGSLFYALADGTLHRVGWTGGFTGKPVAGTDATISGPAVDGRNWSASKALVIGPPNPIVTARKAAAKP